MLQRALALLVTSSLMSIATPMLRAQQEAGESEADEITVPEGTEFKLQLHTTVNSRTSKAGDRVLTTLIDPVSVEDRDVLPKSVRIDPSLRR